MLARALLVAGALLLAGAPGHAQYSVVAVQPLAFGVLTQGITEVVPYTDTFRRGVVDIDGTGIPWVRVVMPLQLIGPLGATIPLQFLTGDVAVQEVGKPAQPFDPAGSTRVNLKKGTASLLIGGRAIPAANQQAGNYSATIVVIVSPTAI